MKYFVFLLSLVVVSSACNKNTDKLPPFDVVYEVTFESYWDAQSHPTDFPSGAHFSPMCILSHNYIGRLYKVDSFATPGIKAMAETGATTPLDEEANLQIARSHVLDWATGSSFNSPGSDKQFIGVSQGFPLVSVVSMIAPSPDWFVANQNINLFFKGEWLQTHTVEAIAYDAGTDVGTTYTSANQPNAITQVISKIVTPPLATNGLVNQMGVFRFNRVK